MSILHIRVILWLLLSGASIATGIIMDIALETGSFPFVVRLLGLVGMLLVHFPLKRTGKLLRLWGKTEKWGYTTRLVTVDIYRCIRHPHHLAIGMFMTFLGLLIGHLWSFLFIAVSQWVWVIAFLFLVEEKELVEKFGDEYRSYSQQVPMLLANPLCILRVLSKSLELPG